MTKSEQIEYDRIVKLTSGTGIGVELISGTSNITITGEGFEPLTKQLGNNCGISAIDVVIARMITKGA